MINWIKGQIEKFRADIDPEVKRFLENILHNISSQAWDDLNAHLTQLPQSASSTFFDLLTESEFFSKIREIYRYRVLRKEEAQIYIENGFSGILLEVDFQYKEPDFGSLRRPSPQELWDSLIEQSRVARNLILTPGAKPPNPFSKKPKEGVPVEWIKVHEDQPVISVLSRSKKIPPRGYIYVYDYGDLDQIQRKRKFVQYFSNFPNPSIDYFCESPPECGANIDNFWSRDDLPAAIIDNWGIFTVQGPPGTGKTYLATEVVGKYLQKYPYAHILVCCKEHLALNHILHTITDKLIALSIPFRGFRSMSRARLERGKPDPVVEKYLQGTMMAEIGSLEWEEDALFWAQIQEGFRKEQDLRNLSLAESSANVYFCTTMDRALKDFLGERAFDLVIVEEAGKCYPSELLHTLCLGPKLLLIGDQNQLPPYQIKETREAVTIWEKALARAKKDGKSRDFLEKRFGRVFQNLLELQERMGKLSEEQYQWLRPFEFLFNILPARQKHVLEEQFRMEKALSDVISGVFYNREFIHKKKASNPLEGVIPSDLDFPMLWIDTPHITQDPEAGEDPEKIGYRVNLYELYVLIAYLRCLKPQPIDMVILTPYNDQKALFLDSTALKEECKKFKYEDLGQIVKTTDEYQGHEADLTLLSLVRNNTLGASSSWGFITEPERLNVMFSRTRTRQVVIGCSEHIERNGEEDRIQIFKSLLDAYRQKGRFIPAKEVLERK